MDSSQRSQERNEDTISGEFTPILEQAQAICPLCLCGCGEQLENP